MTLPRQPEPRNANQAAILSLLRRSQRLSRAELANRSGLSEASVSRTVTQLVEGRLVAEHGVARSTGGRPAILLQLDESFHRSVGVDIHAGETRASLATVGSRFLANTYFKTVSDPMKVLRAVADHVIKLLEECDRKQVAGVGVSTRGLVNSRSGLVERGHEPGWVHVPVREWLQERLCLPVFVENDNRAAAFAEYHYGSPDVQDAHCMLLVGVDEGVAASIVVEGKLYYGQHMAAGEFGQMVIADQSDRATHDRAGCLEKLVCDPAVCARYQSYNRSKPIPAPQDATRRVREICHLAMAGDRVATQTLRETGRYLGIGIANMVWGLDPDAVVVDGTCTEAWPVVGPVIQEQFASGHEFLNFRNLILRPSALRGEAAIIGASALPFQSLFGTSGTAHLYASQNGLQR